MPPISNFIDTLCIRCFSPKNKLVKFIDPYSQNFLEYDQSNTGQKHIFYLHKNYRNFVFNLLFYLKYIFFYITIFFYSYYLKTNTFFNPSAIMDFFGTTDEMLQSQNYYVTKLTN